ncbi:MAG: virulence factor BrkB family protein [Plesiomonas sp.]|uniref:virulence factor BrkB family protein n=1 Tax=Plesiomonas sp. TaxID=2486279 RepID=UPI003F3062B4
MQTGLQPTIWRQSRSFLRLLLARSHESRLTVTAGYLAYVTLLSLVPLVTVIFSVFTAFPVFVGITDKVKHFIFSNFVPATGDVVQNYLDQFVSNSSNMSAVGIIALVVTSLLLISAVDKALNAIWRSKHRRPAMVSFAVYWMILTLGPLLAGTSLVTSSYLLSLKLLTDTGINGALDRLLVLLPMMLSLLSFWLLYSVVPTERVATRHALSGAIFAALLFEVSKKIFTLYITFFPSYQLIYGAMAVIPILFVWVYLSWCIVLLGAEVTAALGEWQQQKLVSTLTVNPDSEGK